MVLWNRIAGWSRFGSPTARRPGVRLSLGDSEPDEEAVLGQNQEREGLRREDCRKVQR